MPVKPSKHNRFAQVVTILDAAAKESVSDYGGLGAHFWRRGAKFIEESSLFGVKLVAPSEPSPCCCASADTPYRRGESSALVKGLRGRAPFDGSRFPQLPWGGSIVSDRDIDFISDWIDDGLPEDESARLDAPLEDAGVTRTVIGALTEFEFLQDNAKRRYRPGELRQRANLDLMSEDELDRLRGAFRAIYDLNRWTEDLRSYNNQALIHQNHCQHGWERFLPWHRAYIYELEQNLQDVAPGVTLPYWDWVAPQYSPQTPEKGWVIPKSFQAFLTPGALETLLASLNPRPTLAQERTFRDMIGMTFVSQRKFFEHVVDVVGYAEVTPKATDANRRRMIDALLESNAFWYPLRYPAEYGGMTIEQRIHYHYPSAADIEQIMSLNNFRDFGGGSIYDAAFGFLDQNPHNTLHIWTGGFNPDAGAVSYAKATNANLPPNAGERRNVMVRVVGRKFHAREDLYDQPPTGDMLSNLTASYDPIFWPVHVNVDRLWHEWQKRHPNANPADLDGILSPWNYTVRDTLDIAPFGYEYVRGTHFMPVGLDACVRRFVSKPIHVPTRAHGFRKAEIRLHWVPQLVRSCFVRAFLNEPSADASTAVVGNPHYGGYLAIFGHGACYGGPGHCDAPPPRPRDYDLRTRNHNMPRNHRIDITDCANRLLQAGADSLRVSLVVIGADYLEDPDVLRVEGVSLNFLD